MEKLVPTAFKDPVIQRLLKTTPKLRVVPRKKTKQEWKTAKLMQEYLNYLFYEDG